MSGKRLTKKDLEKAFETWTSYADWYGECKEGSELANLVGEVMMTANELHDYIEKELKL